LELLRRECKTCSSPAQVTDRLLGVSRKLGDLYSNVQLNAVTDILQARLLGVAILSAQHVDEGERQKLLDQWERVTFRIFGLFGKDARTKVGDYVKLAYRIVTNHIETRTYNQILKELREIGRKDFYESPDACRYLLWNYEEHLATEAGVGATYDAQERSAIWKQRASDTIEHIFPQTPAESGPWTGKMKRSDGVAQPTQLHVGRVGNLLLIPAALNSEAKIRKFSEKKEIYKKHNLRMIHEVCSEADWTLSQIDQREAKVAEWAKGRWSDI